MLRAFRAAEPEAVERVRAELPDKPRITFADAQLVLAREYGFRSWAELGRRIGAVRRAAAGPPGATAFEQMSGDGIFVGQELVPDFGPPLFGRSTFGGRCSIPSDLILRFQVEGQATHLGHVTVQLEQCNQVDFQTGMAVWQDGTAVLTAANGDQLWDRYAGASLPEGQGFEEQHDFVGGTGRFEDASGQAVGRGACDRAAGTCVLEMKGQISLGAASSAGRETARSGAARSGLNHDWGMKRRR